MFEGCRQPSIAPTIWPDSSKKRDQRRNRSNTLPNNFSVKLLGTQLKRSEPLHHLTTGWSGNK